jgi:DNA-binding GntR family transcriptional regulator
MKETAYVEIKKRILSGDLEQNRFLSERQLAAWLEMSQTPVRAALEKLQIQGLVTISPQQGIVVCEQSVADIADQFEFREALETVIVRNLAGRLTPPQIDRLRDNLERQFKTIQAGDNSQNIELDSAFHLLLCEFHGNREFLRAMESLRDKIHRVILCVQARNPQRLELGYEEHSQIAEAVIRGDREAAARLIVQHLQQGRAILLSPRTC